MKFLLPLRQIKHASISSLLVLLTASLFAACTPATPETDLALAANGAVDIEQVSLSIPYQGEQSGDIATRLYLPKLVEQQVMPLVVFSPGFGAKASFYQAYYSHLASHGIAVAAIDLIGELGFDSQHDDKAQQISQALDTLLASNYDFDADRLALAGHSQGAKLAFYAASTRSDIDVVLALDPVNAGGPPCFIAPEECASYPVAANPSRGQAGLLDQLGDTASLILRSEPDTYTNPEPEFNASWFFYGSDGTGVQAVPAPALYIDMGDTAHADYVTLVANQTQQVAKHFMLAWLQQHWQLAERADLWSSEQVEVDRAKGYYQALELRAN